MATKTKAPKAPKKSECLNGYDTCIGPFSKKRGFCCHECSAAAEIHAAAEDEAMGL